MLTREARHIAGTVSYAGLVFKFFDSEVGVIASTRGEAISDWAQGKCRTL